MNKRWVLKACSDPVADNLRQGMGIGTVLARILAARGIATLTDGLNLLSPSLAAMHDPFLLKDMDKGVARLMMAYRNKERICIYGDYDVDGITATTLLVSFFRQTGFDCGYFVPNRFDDGYGLSREALERIAERGVRLVVSVDCGITALDEAMTCKQCGVDLIITDHHTPGTQIPDACAVINPLQPGCDYPFKHLSGVGVAFNLIVALRSRMRQDGFFLNVKEPDVRRWLDLVAMGTIADVVPLLDQNRIFVYHGLKLLDEPERVGIRALKTVAGVKGGVSCGQVGFRLAPRLNAAGRLESAVPGVELLLGDDEGEAVAIADELNTANLERQAVEKQIFDEACAMVDGEGSYPARRSIVLASPSWHQGVVGIVASRMVERYYRPTILMAVDEDGHCKGSGRSINGFHLLDAIRECSGSLERLGGHRYAAGIGLNEENVADFSEAFEAVAARILTDDMLLPWLEVDTEVSPPEITADLVEELKRLEPYGSGNPEPTLLLKEVTVTERRVVGDNHLKLRLRAGDKTFSGIAFRLASRETEGILDVAFYPELNEWNGTTTVQLRIKDIRSAEN